MEEVKGEQKVYPGRFAKILLLKIFKDQLNFKIY